MPEMFIGVPEGKDPIRYVWGELVPGIGPAASAFAMSVYEHSTLGLREFEAARLRIAQINGCLFCQDWRTERDGVKVEEIAELSMCIGSWLAFGRLNRVLGLDVACVLPSHLAG